MKRLLVFAFLIWLVPSVAFGFMGSAFVGAAGGGAAGIAPCSACPDDTYQADERCEDWDSGGRCGAWSTGDPPFDMDVPVTGTLPCGFVTTTMMEVDQSIDSDTDTRLDLPAEEDELWFDIIIRRNAGHSTASDEYFFMASNNTGIFALGLQITSSNKLKVLHVPNGGGSNSTTSNAVLTQDKWDRIALHWLKNQEETGIWVTIYYAGGGSESLTFGDASTTDRGIQRIFFHANGEEGDVVDYDIALLRIDDDAAPTCP